MPAMASIDGVVTALAAAAIPVTDRGLLFGDHVFEIARVVDDRIIDGDAHLARLVAGAARCGLPAPRGRAIAIADRASRARWRSPSTTAPRHTRATSNT